MCAYVLYTMNISTAHSTVYTVMEFKNMLKFFVFLCQPSLVMRKIFVQGTLIKSVILENFDC